MMPGDRRADQSIGKIDRGADQKHRQTGTPQTAVQPSRRLPPCDGAGLENYTAIVQHLEAYGGPGIQDQLVQSFNNVKGLNVISAQITVFSAAVRPSASQGPTPGTT